MRPVLFLLILILISSCKETVTVSDLELLNGYWEIQQVDFPDGGRKEFTVNTNVDYFEVTADSGVRKKVAPRLDGTFKTTKSAEKFTFDIQDGKAILSYETPYNQWQEEILKLKRDLLIVRNADEKTYSYRRYQPINLTE